MIEREPKQIAWCETTQTIAKILTEELSELRKRVMDRVARADDISSREIFAAGASVNQIVEKARGCVDAVQELMHEQLDTINNYVNETTQAVEGHERAVLDAIGKAGQVSDAGKLVGKLAMQAKLLSLNARIEAGRSQDNDRAFVVIAQEMGSLSVAIGETNETVATSADSLTQSLGELRTHLSGIREISQRFSDSLGDLRDRALSLLSTEEGDSGSISEIVRTAYETLTHLQFQDPMIQQLRGIQALFKNLAQTVTDQLGVQVRATDDCYGDRIVTNVGDTFESGDSPESHNAGDVILF